MCKNTKYDKIQTYQIIGRKMNLVKIQKELQADAIQKLEERLQKQNINKARVFEKEYLQPMKKEIIKLREKNLPMTVSKILKQNKSFLKEIKEHLEEFSSWEYYNRLCNAAGEENIKEYLIDDIARFLSIELLSMIEKQNIYFIQDSIFFKLYELLIEYIKDIDTTITTLELQQKQSLTLFTLPLTSSEIIYATFIGLSSLEFLKEKDEDDKINPASEQQLINNISKELYERVHSLIKSNFLISVEEPSNNHFIEMGSELFVIFESFNIIEEQEDIEDRFDTYKFSDSFIKRGKKLLDTISKYATPFFEPMIVAPIKWTTIDDGGYLRGEDISPKYILTIQKTKSKQDRKFLKDQQESISKDFLEAINILQATKYKINKKLLKVVESYLAEEIKETDLLLKERRKDTKQEKKKLQNEIEDLSKKIDSIKDNYAGQYKMLNELISDKEQLKTKKEELKLKRQEESNRYIQKIKALKKEKNGLDKSLRNKKQKLQIQQKIVDLANKYKDFENIYFTWQSDFRGRVYPVQALLNPQGESLAKALLIFSDKKQLGEKGEFWLKVHGANCYGIDKVSFKERIKWVDENRESIQKVAIQQEPFKNEFLKNADDPFKFLEFCYEFDEYLKDKEHFKSSLPVAIDGSNNGFQHISALLRDVQGAKRVNVLPTDEDVPADIYQDVADKLKKILPANYDQIETQDIQEIKKHINRSFVKKGVMTDSYGAGSDTKAKQIAEYMQSKNLFTHIKTEEKSFSKFLAKYLDRAIDEVAPSSAKYKKWINHIAKIISNQEKPIQWHTPFINFQVTQVEYQYKEDRIVTSFNEKKNSTLIRIYNDKIDTTKQAKGIAPNFIHSLDATHLYLTLLEGSKKGINSFATVHDSFATHACDVETLSQTLKEKFIKLMNYNILSHFQEEIATKYGFDIVNKLSNNKEEKLRQIQDIKTLFVDDDFEIEKIRESKYFFA